ncbi:PREDICTED: serine/threonine-protein kinase Nek8-like [Nicrophorus vespilloides]|uniref:non-specific serine/threonine protein kinase n=1 Tax=Nicrophorus vespilloides TaxID=110193 RepID=A0ABM1M0Y4_NICVS|nr:PREDICTED: serine/threonine-protein kinase Nek8-like [Nicrophorus vespilloides]
METYNKLKQLGKGTFGTVYLCERIHNKLKIVVKEINGDLDNKQVEVAKNEVAVLKALNHPNVIQYYDSYLKNGTFFIVMEYAKHGNLYELINRSKPNFIEKDKILSIFVQTLMGLDHIHSKSIIHRDMKCENVLLTGINGDIVKIGDFGISKILEMNYGKTNTIIGTTNYLAPEICDGQPYDTKSDIWSLGCILYELCALERLYSGSMSSVIVAIKAGRRKRINVDILGSELQRIIDSMVEVNPALRPTTTALLAHSFIYPITHTLMLSLGNIPSA